MKDIDVLENWFRKPDVDDGFNFDDALNHLDSRPLKEFYAVKAIIDLYQPLIDACENHAMEAGEDVGGIIELLTVVPEALPIAISNEIAYVTKQKPRPE